MMYEAEPGYGWDAEERSLARYLKEVDKTPFDFSGYVIIGGTEREVFVEDGAYMRGLIPSNIHLKETWEYLQEALHWRRQGWLKRLILRPWEIW